ncbi:MAG: hypothetical protein V4819_15575 [Verrucomicrobiota bacterium]
MKKFAVCYLALMSPLCAENLFVNSTMDTAGGWKGDKKFVKDGDDDKAAKKPAKEGTADKDKSNRCLMLTAKMRDKVSFNQEVVTKGLTALTVKFRYRTKDYIGRGFVLRGTRADQSSTFYDRTLVRDGEWHEMTWDFNQVDGSNKIDFSFTALEGTGDIYFDDIIIEPTKK